MACVSADGTLTPVAATLLRAVADAASPAVASAEAVSRGTGVPLYRVRSTLRELVAAGLLREAEGGGHRVSAEGAARLGGGRL